MRSLPTDKYDIVIRTRFDLMMQGKIADFHSMCKRLHGPLRQKRWSSNKIVLTPWMYLTYNRELFIEYAFMVGTYTGMFEMWHDVVNEVVQHIGVPHYTYVNNTSNPHHFLSMHMQRKHIPCAQMDQEYFTIQRN